MLKVGLFDEEFRHLPNYCGYDQSTKLEWVKDSYEPDILVFTERCYDKVFDDRAKGKVKCAMPLEPPAIHGYAYSNLKPDLVNMFDYVLTHDDSFALWVKENSKATPIFWTPGGSWIWIKDWAIYPKSSNVSIVASAKGWTDGHRFRQQIIDRFSSQFDLICGYGRKTVEPKVAIFADYRYSVVIENSKYNTYWTDKLIDCFACGTIPIFWGSPNIGEFFNPDGIISFDTIGDLGEIMGSIGVGDYNNRLPAVNENFEIAKSKYAIVEEYLADNVFNKIMEERGLK